VVHQECLLKLRDLSLLNFNVGMPSLNVKLMSSIELVQVFNFPLKVLFSLNLLLLEIFLVLGVLLLIKNSLLFVGFASEHDLLDSILSLSVHLLILELLVVSNDFGHNFDIWVSQMVGVLDVVTRLRDTFPCIHFLVKALMEECNCWTS